MASEGNWSDTICEYPPLDINLGGQIVLIAAYGFVGALSLIGNLAVLLVVICRKEMQTVTNIFISSVSAADLVITSFSLWATPLSYYQRVWYFGHAMCYIVPIVQGASLMWVPLTLAAVAYDRYLLVSKPFRPPMQNKTCLQIIVGIWIGALMVLSPQIVQIDFVDSYGPCHFCMENWDYKNQHYRLAYGLFVLLFRSALPLTLISICHWRIASILTSQTKKFKTIRSASTSSQANDVKRKQRLQTLLLAMVVIFAVSSLPIDLFNVLQDMMIVYEMKTVPQFVRDAIFFFSHWIAMAGALLNPLVYAWYNENFRRQFQSCFDEIRGHGSFDRGLYSIVSGKHSHRMNDALPETSKRTPELFSTQPLDEEIGLQRTSV